ncbi:MAG: multidrug efflux SMR transporter [Kiritimatiellia bacterium]
MAWILLFIAIILELTGTTCMKLSNGLTRLWPTATMILCYASCSGCMAVAAKKIDLSIVYGVWCGVGIAVISVIGVLVFKESMTPMKISGLLLVLLGTVLLKLSPGGG